MGPWIFERRTCSEQYTLNLSIPHGTAFAILDVIVFILAFIGLYYITQPFYERTLSHISRLTRTAWDQSFHRLYSREAPAPPTIRSTRRRTPRRRPATRQTPTSPLSPGSLAILAPVAEPPPALVDALNNYQARVARPTPKRSPQPSPNRTITSLPP